MSKNTNHYARQKWEAADFPLLCQTCLGPNPYIRMTKETYGKECKICVRPFTVFRWCPGPKARFKKTEICQTCSKLKNVCQTCLFDLEYGLPTQVRDAALGQGDVMPTSDVNQEYFTQNMEAVLAKTDGTKSLREVMGVDGGGGGKMGSSHSTLKAIARTTPYYKRNAPHICSFWVKGECKRGDGCPYRHEMPNDPNGPLAKQNIKDRYFGVDDPVAQKIMARAAKTKTLTPPADPTITTLYVGGVDGSTVGEQDLRDYFYQFGEIQSIFVVAKQTCAFVEFSSRDAAERAATAAHNTLMIKGKRLKICWGKGSSRSKTGSTTVGGTQVAASANTSMPLPPPGQGGASSYPSMNPARMGASASAK